MNKKLNRMRLQILKGPNYQDMSAIILVTMVLLTTLSEAEECYYKPCQKYGASDKVCQFNIGCKTEGSFAKCDVSSMHLDKSTSVLTKSKSKCIAPDLVPGFKDFCKDLLYNTSLVVPGQANINEDDVTHPAEDNIQESKMVVDSHCFGTTVIASVATGCFLAGGFIMWFLIFCCKLSICQCPRTKDEVVIDVGNNPASWNPSGRGRNIGSTSSAQLLANASIESMSTHNTLLSTSEALTSNDISTPGPSSASHSRASPTVWTESGRPSFGHSRCPSAPWTETDRPLLPSSRSRSAQWTDPGRMSLTRSLAQVSQWNDTDQLSLPRSNTESVRWITQGQSHFTNVHSQSAPWLDTIYSPESEGSSRDYQSIHGGSENPYAPCSESSSDYSAPRTHQVMIIHDGEIYQPSSESSGSNNDYTSLKGQRFSRTNDSIYYPTSEGSNKDYASLANERDDAAAMVSGINIDRRNTNVEREDEERGSNVKFNVSGLTFPYQASCRSNRGWTSNLQEINEYETVGTAKKGAENEIDVSNVRTLADMCDINHNKEASVQPHEYFTLEPRQNQGM